jgi:hypothetical protein
MKNNYVADDIVWVAIKIMLRDKEKKRTPYA